MKKVRPNLYKTGLALILSLFLFLISNQLLAQHGHGRGHGNGAWPDSLETITVEGVVLLDSVSMMNPYQLDVDGDGVGDYRLAFGPYWYEPESGAERPAAGETVTIFGAVYDNGYFPTIVVFEINGLLWREPVENWWHHSPWADSLETVTVTGTVLTDTTYYYTHYYLDEDGDGEPDYFLNFGPPWYEPEGVEKPEAGSIVTIEGGIREMGVIPTIVVFKIDGITWRDPLSPAQWGGRWIHDRGNHGSRIYCPIDSLSWIDFPAGAMHQGGGHHGGGMMFPDSIFVQFMHVFGDSLPFHPDSTMFGFYLNILDPQRGCMNGYGRNIRFNQPLNIAFHYGNGSSGDAPLMKTLNGKNVALKTFDESTQSWVTLSNVAIDEANEVIYLQTSEVNRYYAITISATTTDVNFSESVLPEEIELNQNYPNPFNPITTISYTVAKSGIPVTLSIYNVNGQKVATLVSGIQNAGVHQVEWNGRDEFGNLMPSGVYIYKLETGNVSFTKRMLFMK